MDKEDLFYSLKDLRNQYIRREIENSNFQTSLEKFKEQVVIIDEMKALIPCFDSLEMNDKEKESLINLQLFIKEKDSDISSIRKIIEVDFTNGSR